MKCEYCGAELFPKGKGRPPKYCSKECRRSADRDNKRINYVGKREKTCIQCGCELPKYKTKFCSRKCRLIYSGAIKSPEMLKRECPICGKTFIPHNAQQTCSEKCRKIKRAQNDKNRYIKSHPDYVSSEERHKNSLEHKRMYEKDKAFRAQNREKEKQKRKAEKEAQKQANILHWQQYKQEHVCVMCNKTYIAHYPLQKYCTPKCQRRKYPKIKKRLKGKVIDKDITLKKLAKRDNDCCQICGLAVDWTDKVIKKDTIICGNYYPSIDHIVPISKGGMHSWDNVQLAHRKCNSYKNDNTFKTG